MNSKKLDRHLRRMAGQSLRTQKARQQTVRVMIQYHERLHDKHIRRLRRWIGRKLADRHVRLPLLRAVRVHVPIRHLPRISREKDVKYVYIDRQKRITLNTATPTIGSRLVDRLGYTGKGIAIAVLDTGVYRHPDLTLPSNRIASFHDVVNGRRLPYDDNGHGTHCAGDALGNGYASNGTYAGPAPEAKLVSVKVLDKKGSGYDSDVIKGVEWCIRNKKRFNIRVMSLSLGGKADLPWQRDPLCQALNLARKAGIVVVVSAGNSGPGRGTIESPAISPYVISVGAYNDHGTFRLGDDDLAPFSSRGPAKGGIAKPDLIAPGVNITSLRAPGSLLDHDLPDNRVGQSYFKLTGTSMAAPLVAGACAQLIQQHPEYKPLQVKRALKQHAASLGLPVFKQGSGKVDVRFMKNNRSLVRKPRRQPRS